MRRYSAQLRYNSSCGPTASTLPSSIKTILSSCSTVENAVGDQQRRLARAAGLEVVEDDFSRCGYRQPRQSRPESGSARFQQGTRNRDALLLSAGDGHAALTEYGLVAVLEVHDVVPHMAARRRGQCRPGWRRPRRSRCCGQSCPRTGSCPAARSAASRTEWMDTAFTSCPSTNRVPSGTL